MLILIDKHNSSLAGNINKSADISAVHPRNISASRLKATKTLVTMSAAVQGRVKMDNSMKTSTLIVGLIIQLSQYNTF